MYPWSGKKCDAHSDAVADFVPASNSVFSWDLRATGENASGLGEFWPRPGTYATRLCPFAARLSDDLIQRRLWWGPTSHLVCSSPDLHTLERFRTPLHSDILSHWCWRCLLILFTSSVSVFCSQVNALHCQVGRPCQVHGHPCTSDLQT